jgi:hypothetical protein
MLQGPQQLLLVLLLLLLRVIAAGVLGQLGLLLTMLLIR